MGVQEEREMEGIFVLRNIEENKAGDCFSGTERASEDTVDRMKF